MDEGGCWIFGDPGNDPDEYGHIRYERCVNPEHLQAVTHKQNLENFSNPTGWGTSGVRGVYRTKRGSWAAEARDGDSRHRKTLKTKREAVEWVRETRLKFHTNNLLDRA